MTVRNLTDQDHLIATKEVWAEKQAQALQSYKNAQQAQNVAKEQYIEASGAIKALDEMINDEDEDSAEVEE